MEALLNVQKKMKYSLARALANFINYPKDRLSLEYIEIRLDLLERDWSLFRENYYKLYSLSELEQTKIENTEDINDSLYDEVENTYIEFKTCLQHSLKEFIITSSSTESLSRSVKLPKITIPTFSGNYLEWTTFRNMFISLVHNNSELNNVQKLHYLKSQLSGEAEQLIRHTPITHENYDRCWKIIEHRYNNKRYLINCILRRLLEQKPISKESSALLKSLLDTTVDCLSALRNLNVDVTSWDVIIIHIIAEKLDLETRKQWELSSQSLESSEIPSISDFTTFIEKRFRAIESIETVVDSSQFINSPTCYIKSMVATKIPKMRCEYCSELHKLCFCKKFAPLSLYNKQKFVEQNNICKNCLGSNHTVNNCKKRKCCRICHGRHHSLLHNLSHPIKNEKFNKAPYIATRLSDNSTTKSQAHLNQVLLPTALVQLKSRFEREPKATRALIDQGSQFCFISRSLVHSLQLKKLRVRENIGGICRKSTKINHKVKLTLQSRIDKDFKLNIDAYVLDDNMITMLPDQNVHANSLKWIKCLKNHLADSNFHISDKIDLLLGADIYSLILKDGVIKNPSGSMLAQDTTFGWIISGTVGL